MGITAADDVRSSWHLLLTQQISEMPGVSSRLPH
jgi:hypothetical protein